MATDTAVKQYPRVGEVFELELDADVDDNTPLGIVKTLGYDPEDWEFRGAPLTSKLKGKFMLVKIGAQPNLDAAKAALEDKHGPTPSGQWMRLFKDAYPETDGNGPVGIADASWVYPDDSARFPCVDYGGWLTFGWAAYYSGEDWRWLVTVPEGE